MLTKAPNNSPTAASDTLSSSAPLSAGVTAIVPARNEEPVIAACVESLARQPEIAEILVVNDESSDRTAEIVRGLMTKIPRLKLFEIRGVPAGWVGKNYAASVGASHATGAWLLFTDADAEEETGAARHALDLARETGASLVSFSPEQVTQQWYEKALIPFVYCRLAKYFSFDAVNDPASDAAAANGQFLMIRRDAYEAIGGHASVAGEVLEDVALARRVKSAGFRLWFASGAGIVRVRMYRSFTAMWQGWKKNLYLLIGGRPIAVFREMADVFPWIPFLVIFVGLKIPLAAFLGVWLLIFRQIRYGSDLRRNHFSFSLILYYVPAVLLYTCVLWASYRSHAKGKVEWKGREVPVSVPGTTR
jgi:cellulose synthase/poly-beta-1,6-N-acetylglucosamine synthase-like glycosyltransferase